MEIDLWDQITITVSQEVLDYIGSLKDVIADHEFEIERLEKLIPAPKPPRKKRAPKSKYGLESLDIGQCVYLAGETAANRLNGSAQPFKKVGFRFHTETVEENGIIGARIWRLA